MSLVPVFRLRDIGLLQQDPVSMALFISHHLLPPSFSFRLLSNHTTYSGSPSRDLSLLSSFLCFLCFQVFGLSTLFTLRIQRFHFALPILTIGAALSEPQLIKQSHQSLYCDDCVVHHLT